METKKPIVIIGLHITSARAEILHEYTDADSVEKKEQWGGRGWWVRGSGICGNESTCRSEPHHLKLMAQEQISTRGHG